MGGSKRNQVSFVGNGSDGEEASIDQDLNIVFLDAASDSNTDAIKEVLQKCKTEEELKAMLTFQDGDLNTALHFGARNGNVKICQSII